MVDWLKTTIWEGVGEQGELCIGGMVLVPLPTPLSRLTLHYVAFVHLKSQTLICTVIGRSTSWTCQEHSGSV